MASASPNFSKHLSSVLSELRELLMQRHRHHGDSAFNPVAVFHKGSAEERLRVMLDYKLTRFSGGSKALEEENINDLIGYLILLKISRRQQGDT
tara:strand:+ start:24733 stop:25014 length:282 start_codon:yes stop_codon:yes gene_type:complete